MFFMVPKTVSETCYPILGGILPVQFIGLH